MDFNNIQKDLLKACEADKRYEMENNAKFRAVEQKVESYDQFVAIVKGCHLLPIGKKESITNLSNSSSTWNSCAHQKNDLNTSLVSEINKYFPNSNPSLN